MNINIHPSFTFGLSQVRRLFHGRADRQAAADVRGGGGMEVKCKELLRKSYLQGHNLFSVSGRNPLKLQRMSDRVVKSVSIPPMSWSATAFNNTSIWNHMANMFLLWHPLYTDGHIMGVYSFLKGQNKNNKSSSCYVIKRIFHPKMRILSFTQHFYCMAFTVWTAKIFFEIVWQSFAARGHLCEVTQCCSSWSKQSY